MGRINGNNSLTAIRTAYLDVDMKLIWQNANPSSSFSEITLTDLPNMASCKYLVFMWKHWKGDDHTFWGLQATKVENGNIENENYFIITINLHRMITKISNTSIKIDNAKYNSDSSSGSNDLLIPVAIYGTNVL